MSKPKYPVRAKQPAAYVAPVFDCTPEQAAEFLATSNMCLNNAAYSRGRFDTEHVFESRHGLLKPKSGRGCEIIWNLAFQILENDEQADGLEAEMRSWVKDLRAKGKKADSSRKLWLDKYSMNIKL